MSDTSWEKIFADYHILKHDFNKSPFYLDADMIKTACQGFTKTSEKEVRILCKNDTRSDLPQIMSENGLFILPVKNGEYVIVKGDGYIDIPDITSPIKTHKSHIQFELETAKIGDSEMQHLDFAYASSLIRTFCNDDSLILTIRGRKYTPEFSFMIDNHQIHVKSVQTEIDAGYEGENKVVLVEAKNTNTDNTIIRQLFYPLKQWYKYTTKEILLLFFEKREDEYLIWQFAFKDSNDYNSISLVKSERYQL